MGMFTRERRFRSARKGKSDGTAGIKARLIAFSGVIVLAFGALSWQLWNMQVVNGASYLQRAENNRLRIQPIPAPRGILYDRSGQQLVTNIPSFTIAVTLADLPEPGPNRDTVLQSVSNITGLSPDEVQERLAQARARGEAYSPIPLVTNAPKEMALSVEENAFRLPGVRVRVDAVREYVEGTSLAQLTGYVGRISAEEFDRNRDRGYSINDRIGKAGIELTMESVLRGSPGRETAEYDASGAKVQTLGSEPPVPGNSVVLTLDMELQEAMRQALVNTRKDSEQSVGIAMDVRTGEILAMVSLPGYDNNFFSRPMDDRALTQLINDPRRPLLNHAITSAFPPGSIFKIIVGAAALQEGIATPNTVITSYGQITVANQFDPNAPGFVFRDWSALGTLDFRRALAMSSDVYYYYLAGGFREPGGRDFRGMGPNKIAEYARNFGLGRPTGIRLPGEASGVVPTPELKLRTYNEPWVLGDTYNMGIGQGFTTTTPIQMVNATAAVANGGTLWEPQIVRQVLDPDGRVVQPFQRRALSTIEVSQQHLQIIREGMHQTVTNGTAGVMRTSGLDSAGKTGTAEYTARDPITGYGKTHAWYVGYAPYNNPEIAFIVFHQSGGGSQDAAPAAAEFLKAYAEWRQRNPGVGSAR